MLEKLMKLYVTSTTMPGGVRSPMPHLFGPPGCGKSSVMNDLARVVGKKVHVINVSRISPLELEGVQMPDMEQRILHMLPATFWTQLEEGDILLLDEFLRGFPEVYNGLLDILTSRRVGQFELPNVFIVGASNTVVAYDAALSDRLLHLPVDDPRGGGSRNKARSNIARRLVQEVGLLPDMDKTAEMSDLLTEEILPTYDILDQIGPKATPGWVMKGRSLRNLIGQAQMREVQSDTLQSLIDTNNRRALADGKLQYILLTTGAGASSGLKEQLESIVGNRKLTPLQAHNLDINLQLISMEEARAERENDDDDLFPISG